MYLKFKFSVHGLYSLALKCARELESGKVVYTIAIKTTEGVRIKMRSISFRGNLDNIKN